MHPKKRWEAEDPAKGSWLDGVLRDASLGFGDRAALGFRVWASKLVPETRLASEISEAQQKKLLKRLKLAHKAYKIGMFVERTW